MNTLKLACGLAPALVLLVACGSGSGGDSGSSGTAMVNPITASASSGAGGAASSATTTTTSSSSASSGSGGMGGCAPIANVATTIDDTQNGAALPTAMGGMIADGTYTMTGHITYAGAPFTARKHTYTIKIAGTDLDLVGHDNADAEVAGRFKLTADSAKASSTVIGTCPAALVGKSLGSVSAYTASGTVIKFYETDKKHEIVFTKK